MPENNRTTQTHTHTGPKIVQMRGKHKRISCDFDGLCGIKWKIHFTFITKATIARLIKYKFHEPLSTPIKIETPFSCNHWNHLFYFSCDCVSVYICMRRKSKSPVGCFRVPNSKFTAYHRIRKKIGEIFCKFSSLNHDYVWFMWTNLFCWKNCFPFHKAK